MTYLLDTDVLTLVHLGRHGLRERIEVARQQHEVVISIVSRIEVLRGRFDAVVKAADGAALLRAQEWLRGSETFLADFHILPLDAAAANEFDRLREDKRVKKTGRNDLLIACIALATGATLVTRNIKDYASVPGLKLENWAD
ncbi:type II toxin-antitoxin system VapC family toxin [Gemmata sp. G18]|uniref:Type II toxin-antitoxin system VapC family toxin n=1 Tax=Gemmata palustris TaxID=2822762 RepID=A0ABS5C0U1_9BACT|nr:type II toxin-antitoxin system VapC family toxin [Gemmata palustris]MBP3958753.1 type II toxin-antitoxin system VapC family toxin [Gemmata palustris]